MTLLIILPYLPDTHQSQQQLNMTYSCIERCKSAGRNTLPMSTTVVPSDISSPIGLILHFDACDGLLHVVDGHEQAAVRGASAAEEVESCHALHVEHLRSFSDFTRVRGP